MSDDVYVSPSLIRPESDEIFDIDYMCLFSAPICNSLIGRYKIAHITN